MITLALKHKLFLEHCEQADSSNTYHFTLRLINIISVLINGDM